MGSSMSLGAGSCKGQEAVSMVKNIEVGLLRPRELYVKGNGPLLVTSGSTVT